MLMAETRNDKNISVIVPVYNVESYLKECLDSILQQNFQGFEVICVNDGATDDSGLILQDYARKYEQVRIFTHPENLGLSEARNTGLKHAEGKYIWFVDSDDWILQGSLEALFEKAEKSRTDIIYFRFKSIYGSGDYRKVSEEKHMAAGTDRTCSGREFFCRAVEKGLMPTAWMQFIRRDFLTQHHINFYPGILHEDVMFWFFSSLSAGKVLETDREFYLRRNREGSIMNTKNYKRAESLFVILMQSMEYWNADDFTETENKAIGAYMENLYRGYEYYRRFGRKTKELSVGGYKEKLLYRILHRPRKGYYLTFDQYQTDLLRRAKHIVMFGCGRGSYDLITVLQEHKIKIDAVAVSSLEGNPDYFFDIKVEALNCLTFDRNDTIVVIGVTEKYRSGISDNVRKLGYKHIMIPKSIGGPEDDSRYGG